MIKNSESKASLRSSSKNNAQDPVYYLRFHRLGQVKGRTSLRSKNSNNSLDLSLKKEELHGQPEAQRKPKRMGVYCKTVGFEGQAELIEYVKQIRAVRHNLKRNTVGRQRRRNIPSEKKSSYWEKNKQAAGVQTHKRNPVAKLILHGFAKFYDKLCDHRIKTQLMRIMEVYSLLEVMGSSEAKICQFVLKACRKNELLENCLLVHTKNKYVPYELERNQQHIFKKINRVGMFKDEESVDDFLRIFNNFVNELEEYWYNRRVENLKKCQSSIEDQIQFATKQKEKLLIPIKKLHLKYEERKVSDVYPRLMEMYKAGGSYDRTETSDMQFCKLLTKTRQSLKTHIETQFKF